MKEDSGTHFDSKIMKEFLKLAKSFYEIVTTNSEVELKKYLEKKRKLIFGM